jgi:hypothetical protein
MSKTIDAKKVLASFLGINITGYAEGTYIDIDFPEDYTLMNGAQGDVSRVRQNDETATVMIRLLPTSPSNADLSKVRLAGKATGLDFGPMSVTDLRDGYVCASAEAWIAKPPRRAWSLSGEVMEWTFHMSKYNEVPGGLLNG